MNALLHRVARGLADRGLADRVVEIGVVAVLAAVTIGVTWWFAPLTVLTTAWWAAAEVRLRRARRGVPASPLRAELGAAGADSPAVDMPAEPVSAGQQVDGRAGA